jgi:signal transduction histidine kinase
MRYRLRRHDGEYRNFLAKIFPIYNDDNEFQYYQGYQIDVTSEYNNKIDLEYLLENTNRQNNRLREYAYMTSHNIRSSVSQLSGLINLLINNPEDRTYLQLMDNSVKKLDETIFNINELLKLEQGTYSDKLIDVKIKEVIDRAINHHQRELEEKEITIDISFSGDENMRIKTIPAYLESIVQNLLSNAIKYGITWKSKSIWIAINKVDDLLKIVVRDQGNGFDTELNKDKIFKLGARFHDSSKGQGIGLFMIKRQIEILGGSIEVSSKVDQGSTFQVTLPL